MIISSRQIIADRQHLDSSGKNVRQWIYEEEPLINEGDEEIPVTKLHVKADLLDTFNYIKVPIGVGDRVRWNDLGLSRMGSDDDLEDIRKMHGTVTGFVYPNDGDVVYVQWHTFNPHPQAFEKCHVKNLEKALTARADLIDALKLKQLQERHLQETLAEPDVTEAKFRRGDKVYLNRNGFNVLPEEFTEYYDGNVGTVLRSGYEEDEEYGSTNEIICWVKWTNPVGTPDGVSIWKETSLDPMTTRNADLRDRINKTRQFRNGDRVRVRKQVDLGSLNDLYRDNIGTVVDARGYSYDVNPKIVVKWDNNVGLTKEMYESNLYAESLEFA